MPQRFERRLGAALVALALAASALTGLAQAVARFGPAAHAAAPTGCDRRHGVSGHLLLGGAGAAGSSPYVASVGGEIATTHSRVLGAPVHQSFGPQADAARVAAGAPGPRMRVGGMVGRLPSSSVGATPLVRAAPPGVTVSRDDSEPEALVNVFQKHKVLVGQWWSRMKGVTESWRYSQGSTSRLEIAASVTGQPGSYSGGSISETSTSASVAWPTARGKSGTFYLTYFRYARYLVSYCDGTIGCQPWEWLIKPYSWERGTAILRHIPYPSVTEANCVPYVAGSRDYSAGSTAVTWINGVTIGGDLLDSVGAHLTLSSQTGFTKQAENVVRFQRAGELCGTLGSLAANPGALLAKPPKARGRWHLG